MDGLNNREKRQTLGLASLLMSLFSILARQFGLLDCEKIN